MSLLKIDQPPPAAVNALTNAVYTDLGVEPVIHAAGTKSSVGGSRMHPQVIEAMVAASQSFVSLTELNIKIGDYIAKITGAEAGMVTSGAASGVVLSIAACMTGTDITKVRQLPDATGMKNELIIQKIHRGTYSHMYTFTGARFVEVGDFNDCLADEMEAAINENTVAITYLLGPRVSRTGLSLAEVVAIAHRHKIPVIVDAAAMLPPKTNLRKYIDEGADLVTMSGGKLIHGPQASGLLFGRKALVAAAMANANPNHSIGRPHKVSKEAMVGLYTALKIYLAYDEEKMLNEYRKRLDPVIKALNDIKGVDINIIHDGINYHVPVLAITFNADWQGPRAADFPKKMMAGRPRIFMQYFKELGHLVVNPISLQAGEPDIVALCLRNELIQYTHARKSQ